jgi:hypothetical protein
MYAIFLLALLADVAWSQVPAVVGGDSAGGLILSAAGQLRDGSGWEKGVDLRRSNRVFVQRPGFRSYRLTTSVWANVLSGHAWKLNPSDSVGMSDHAVAFVLACSVCGHSPGAGSWFASGFALDAPSPGVYEHLGSPAP